MKKIKLLNGNVESYDFKSNDLYNFYYGSGVHSDMNELKTTLESQGLDCTLDLHPVNGWFLRVSK